MSTDTVVPTVSPHGVRIAAMVGAAIAVAIVAVGVSTRVLNRARLRQVTYALALPVVTVTTPVPADPSYSIDLPGRLQAYANAPIYARVSGYLKNWYVDIGGRVKAGQLLAEIDAPDIDQQLAQERANLLTAQANAALARTTAIRWRQLFKTHSVSEQDLDVREGDDAAKQAIVKATRASVDRLRVLQGFERIVAPFDGIVTARLTDIGDLVDAGNSGQRRELFIVSDTRKLRLYVYVPQNYATEVTSGIMARLTVPGHPGRTYAATVESSAQAVEPSSGSTLVQLGVDNASGQLAPGAFANVNFNVPEPSVKFAVPASAVIIDHNGVRVATLGPDNRVALKFVKIARDLGDTIDISSGLAANDRVVATPPDGITNGDQVRLATAPRIPGAPTETTSSTAAGAGTDDSGK